MTNAAAEPLDPERYLQEVLDYVQRQSVKRRQLDWEVWRAEVLAMAAGAASVADTYPAIRHGLQLLGDRHSHFRDPEQTAQSRRALAQQGYLSERRPAGRLAAAGIALLELPGCACRGQETCGPYAEAVQRAIRQLADAGGRGWIVDLRQNGGGNLWPMLAGIGPVLGEGACGAFVGPDGDREVWGYAGGASHIAGARECWVAAPYRLRQPSPPSRCSRPAGR